MMTFSRICAYALAGGAMLGLVGCSLAGNGYGGWYWQAPELPISASSTSAGMNSANSNNTTHAKSGISTQSNTQHG